MIDPIRERLEAYTHSVNKSTKIPHIGTKVLYENDVYHVQDVNHLSMQAKIGIPDKNDIVWDIKWVDYSELNNI